MPSKTLMAVWGALDFALLAAGGISIAFSIIWKAPDLLRNLVLTDMDLTFGMIVGVFYAITFVVSIGAVIQQNHVTLGLALLNWLIIIDTLVTVIFGTMVWVVTLKETAHFNTVWGGLSSDKRVLIQDLFTCCGFLNITEGKVDRDAAMIERVGICDTDNTTRIQEIGGCADDFVKFADYTLMNIFTTIYGFTAVLVCLFICTMCVIKKRQEKERFRKIDAKRGGGGFV